jgi:serine/threonine-protein kinase
VEYEGRIVPSLGGIPLLSRIGHGGMGTVYFGMHLRLDKEVAVKVLPFHMAEREPELVQRFYTEARAATKVQSPHLVTVLDVNEDNGLLYLVMEYIYGIGAGAYLKRLRKRGQFALPEHLALDICIGAASGLAAAHKEGIIHRDVKPDNILIPADKHSRRIQFADAKLSDLGLARCEGSCNEVTHSAVSMGTPGYMAPEQGLSAKRAGKPADVFSLGATLYALLTGVPPFSGESVVEAVLNALQQQHTPLVKMRPDVTSATAYLVERCLTKDPEKRFPDGTALLNALVGCRMSPSVAEAEARAVAEAQVRKSEKTGPSGNANDAQAQTATDVARVRMEAKEKRERVVRLVPDYLSALQVLKDGCSKDAKTPALRKPESRYNVEAIRRWKFRFQHCDSVVLWLGVLAVAVAIPLGLNGVIPVCKYLLPPALAVAGLGVFWRHRLKAIIGISLCCLSIPEGSLAAWYFKQQDRTQRQQLMDEATSSVLERAAQLDAAESEAAENQRRRHQEQLRQVADAEAARKAEARRAAAEFDREQRRKEALLQQTAEEKQRLAEEQRLAKLRDEEEQKRKLQAAAAKKRAEEQRALDLSDAKAVYREKMLNLDACTPKLENVVGGIRAAREDIESAQMILDRIDSPRPPSKEEYARAERRLKEAKEELAREVALLPAAKANVENATKEKEAAAKRVDELEREATNVEP